MINQVKQPFSCHFFPSEYNQGIMQAILYDVVTLYDCMQDPATLAWLSHLDLPLPGTAPPGRYPTPEEIKASLDSISGLQIFYSVSENAWEASIISRKDITWANLAVKDYDGDSAYPHHFCFTAGWDEIILIVASHLVRKCGPLVLLPDSGDLPQVIY
jgi:hypothetical protein